MPVLGHDRNFQILCRPLLSSTCMWLSLFLTKWYWKAFYSKSNLIENKLLIYIIKHEWYFDVLSRLSDEVWLGHGSVRHKRRKTLGHIQEDASKLSPFSSRPVSLRSSTKSSSSVVYSKRRNSEHRNKSGRKYSITNIELKDQENRNNTKSNSSINTCGKNLY